MVCQATVNACQRLSSSVLHIPYAIVPVGPPLGVYLAAAAEVVLDDVSVSQAAKQEGCPGHNAAEKIRSNLDSGPGPEDGSTTGVKRVAACKEGEWFTLRLSISKPHP